jgi:hypothetical protein
VTPEEREQTTDATADVQVIDATAQVRALLHAITFAVVDGERAAALDLIQRLRAALFGGVAA